MESELLVEVEETQTNLMRDDPIDMFRFFYRMNPLISNMNIIIII